jgi:hypothetical protein
MRDLRESRHVMILEATGARYTQARRWFVRERFVLSGKEFFVSQEHRSCPPFHCLFDAILLSSAQEAAHFALRKEPNYFTRLNN